MNHEECCVYVRTDQAQIIRSLVELLKDLIFEATFVFSESGIKVSSMDSSKSSLVYLKLEASAFEEYHVQGEHHVGVSLQLLHKLVKISTSSDTLTLFVRKTLTHELGIHIQNRESNNKTLFSLKMLDLNYTNITLPSLEYEHVVQINSQMFQRLIRDMQNLAPNVALSTGPDTDGALVLSCVGDFAQQTTTIGERNELPPDAGRGVLQPFSSTYSLKYLALFSKSSSLSSSLTIYMSSSQPLVLCFLVGSLGNIKFLLSPIDTDTE